MATGARYGHPPVSFGRQRRGWQDDCDKGVATGCGRTPRADMLTIFQRDSASRPTVKLTDHAQRTTDIQLTLANTHA